jgi:hypothetical protein
MNGESVVGVSANGPNRFDDKGNCSAYPSRAPINPARDYKDHVPTADGLISAFGLRPPSIIHYIRSAKPGETSD